MAEVSSKPSVRRWKEGGDRHLAIERTVDDAGLAELRAPRTVTLLERQTGPNDYVAEAGPVDRYHRTITWEPVEAGSWRVHEQVSYKLALPVWAPLFAPLVRKAVVQPPAEGSTPWWAPPDILDARAARSISLLCVFAVFAGYLGVLLSQTNTYFKEEFGSSNAEIGVALIGVRLGGVLALVILALADRRGRKKVLLLATFLGIGLAAVGALAPNLVVLGTTQTMSRACSAAIAFLVVIMAAEEMPPNSRAFAVSVQTMSAALGAGGVILFLTVADQAVWAWRIFYAVPLLMIWPTILLGRQLLETRRYEVLEAQEELHDERLQPDRPDGVNHLRRFVTLAATAFMFNIFLTPASNFLNEYLRTEQDYSGLQITGLQVLTNLPGGLAIVVGGRLADRYGRRIIGAIGVAGGAGFTVLMYNAVGGWIWLFSGFATLLGALSVPALGVYGPELFPTGSRGLAGGGLTIAGVAGATTGLITAGLMADAFGSFSPTMAILGIAPLLVVLTILLFYPETAHRTLEELNPEDAPPPDARTLAEIEQDLAEHHAAHGHHVDPLEHYHELHEQAAPEDGPPQPPRLG